MFSISGSQQHDVRPDDVSHLKSLSEEKNVPVDVQQATDAIEDPIDLAEIGAVADPNQNLSTVQDLQIRIEHGETHNVVTSTPKVKQPVVTMDDIGPENPESLCRQIETDIGSLVIHPEQSSQQPGQAEANQMQQQTQNQNAVNARRVSEIQKT